MKTYVVILWLFFFQNFLSVFRLTWFVVYNEKIAPERSKPINDETFESTTIPTNKALDHRTCH